MPVFWGSSCWRLPQPDFSATSLRTPIMRAASRSASAGLAEGLADGMRGALRRSRRNCTGSSQENALLRGARKARSEEHTSELQSHSDLVCRLLLEKKKENSETRHQHN